MWFNYLRSWIQLVLHQVQKQKVVKWINIWDRDHNKWLECHLFTQFEISITWWKDWKIVPHCNPCMSNVSFWNLESSNDEILKEIKRKKQIIISIIQKMDLKWWEVDQYILCKMCELMKTL